MFRLRPRPGLGPARRSGARYSVKRHVGNGENNTRINQTVPGGNGLRRRFRAGAVFELAEWFARPGRARSAVIHAFLCRDQQLVDARDKPTQDGGAIRAEKAAKRPAPARRRMLSARIKRVALAAPRNKRLKMRSCMTPSAAPATGTRVMTSRGARLRSDRVGSAVEHKVKAARERKVPLGSGLCRPTPSEVGS